MAGFEGIVRPVIFPSIRPAPSRALPPEDDPTKGFAVIHGASGQQVDLPYSWSVSTSRSKQQEVERVVDNKRVYQKEADGTINRDNYIDIQVAKKIAMDESGPGYGTPGAVAGGGVGILPGEKVITEYFYNSETDKVYDNIETMEKDIKIKNENRV